MAFLLGKKIGMTQVFNEDGVVTPVTLIQAGPIMVTQVKTKEKDGYEAVQVGYGNDKKPNKPKAGHLKGLKPSGILKETKMLGDKKRGEELDVSVFNVGDVVKVSGISKAKGFQGVVKRHGFHGMPASHGHHHVLRHGGSIGQRFPQHTLKGMRMPGRMGGKRVTTRGLKIVSIDKENNLLALKGAIPGRRGTLLEIQKI
ncbi:MAG: 50S ribosomal protein L3 [Candidatus Yanofskybacteria bacterium]|nr:50S ribosomal protein L3 [Candidatus Yanofskybacteria bacterium]